MGRLGKKTTRNVSNNKRKNKSLHAHITREVIVTPAPKNKVFNFFQESSRHANSAARGTLSGLAGTDPGECVVAKITAEVTKKSVKDGVVDSPPGFSVIAYILPDVVRIFFNINKNVVTAVKIIDKIGKSSDG